MAKKKKHKKKTPKETIDWQDDRFYFIAGYTSGGAPYGVTWEEMGFEPYEREIDEDVVSCRHYDALNERDKEFLNNILREDFTKYVSQYRRLPGKVARKTLIEKAFENCPGGPLLYTKDFNTAYRKIVRKRENRLIREGILPKRVSPTELKNLYKQSVILESELLIFRKLNENDFDDLAEMFRNPEVMTAWEHTFSDDEIRDWIAKQDTRYREYIVGYFAAINKDSGEFVGQMGLMWSDIGELRALEIGYMLKRGNWGLGYAIEGASALVEYAFTEIGLNKVYATIRPENKRSTAVAERIGMSAEGSYVKQYQGKEMEHTIYSKYR
jgi:RimJ/RimL family protein N-acetyltransferase